MRDQKAPQAASESLLLGSAARPAQGVRLRRETPQILPVPRAVTLWAPRAQGAAGLSAVPLKIRQRGGRNAMIKVPREHGFWVMLSVALLSGVTLGGSGASLGLAAFVFGGAFLGAVAVGRRIRKNVPLQVLAALVLGALVFPVARAGDSGVRESLVAAGTLSLVFSSTTMSVQAILFRARKRRVLAKWSGYLAVFATLAGLGGSVFLRAEAATWAMGFTLALNLSLVVWPPSAKRLRFVGMAIGCVQLLAAGALTTLDLAPF